MLCNGRELDAFTIARQSLEPFLPTPPPAASPGAGPAPASVAAPAPAPAALRALAGTYYNPTTLAIRVVELRDGKLHWVRGGSATPLDPVGPGRFRFPPGQPAELEFPAQRPGTAQEMRLISGGSVTPYQRAEPFDQAPSRLAAYAGAYTSEEVGVTLQVAVKDSSLELGTPGSWRFRVQPIFRDAFAIPEAVVLRFTRDTRGRVDGFVADMGRSRGMRFRRR